MRYFKPVRESFLIPGALKIADKQSDAIAYAYEINGKIYSQVFFGKQAKPVQHYRHLSQMDRENSIRRAFEGRRASLKAKDEAKAKRLAPNKLEVGDILNTSWGYDQTNREFFEVTAVSGQYVTLCEIAQVRKGTCYNQGHCVPQSGSFIGKPMRKLVQYGDHVTIDECRTAWKWNTQTVAGVPVGPSLSWSEGH